MQVYHQSLIKWGETTKHLDWESNFTQQDVIEEVEEEKQGEGTEGAGGSEVMEKEGGGGGGMDIGK